MVITIVLFFICASVILLVMYKSGHFLKSLLKSAFQGIAAMLAVNAVGLVSGISIPLNLYTVGFSALFGLPASIFMLITDIIMKV